MLLPACHTHSARCFSLQFRFTSVAGPLYIQYTPGTRPSSHPWRPLQPIPSFTRFTRRSSFRFRYASVTRPLRVRCTPVTCPLHFHYTLVTSITRPLHPLHPLHSLHPLPTHQLRVRYKLIPRALTHQWHVRYTRVARLLPVRRTSVTSPMQVRYTRHTSFFTRKHPLTPLHIRYTR